MRVRERESETIRMGKLIRHLRKSSSMTQMDLAEKMGITYQQIQKYENGKSELTVNRLRQMADALNAPLSVFIGESDGRPFVLEDEETELLTAFRRIEDESLKRMARRMLMSIAEV